MGRIARLLALHLALFCLTGVGTIASGLAESGASNQNQALHEIAQQETSADTVKLSTSPLSWSKVEMPGTVAGSLHRPAVLLRTIFPLTWTAPGDDGYLGQATKYDIRYSRIPLSNSSWEQATKLEVKLTPQPAGTTQSLTIVGLPALERFYFALKTADEAMCWSVISNLKHDSARTVVAICGDVDANGLLSISDATALGAYIFAYGAAPSPLQVADMDCNGIVSISDVIYFINYLFFSGAPPCCVD